MSHLCWALWERGVPSVRNAVPSQKDGIVGQPEATFFFFSFFGQGDLSITKTTTQPAI